MIRCLTIEPTNDSYDSGMPERPLTGEPLALDLVNTEWRTASGPQDLFGDDAAVLGWLDGHGLRVPGADAPALRGPLVKARAAIREALEGADPRWEGLDRVLAHGRVRLRATGERVVEDLEAENAARIPAWRCAQAFGHLVAERGDRIRACAGEGCVLWFLDTSRNGTRRWCSMAGCGNRAKARAHYSRSTA